MHAVDKPKENFSFLPTRSWLKTQITREQTIKKNYALHWIAEPRGMSFISTKRHQLNDALGQIRLIVELKMYFHNYYFA